MALYSNNLEYFERNLYTTFQFDGMKVLDQDIIDTTGQVIRLSEIVKNRSVLIVRYEAKSCQECIIFAVSKVNACADTIRTSPVVFAQYDEHYPFKVAGRNMSQYPFYNVSEELPLDKLQIPYYFMLHDDLRVSELFIPDKSFPRATTRYLEIIIRKYFTDY